MTDGRVIVAASGVAMVDEPLPTGTCVYRVVADETGATVLRNGTRIGGQRGLQPPELSTAAQGSGRPEKHRATGRFGPVGCGYLRAMTSAHSRADSFAAALRNFEDTGNSSQLRELFGRAPELVRPQVVTGDDGTSDVARFWEEYRSQFSRISTEFVRVVESDDLGVLEWVSRGTLTTGRAIEYSGISLLDFDDQDRIRRFATYFDTAAFLRSETPSK